MNDISRGRFGHSKPSVWFTEHGVVRLGYIRQYHAGSHTDTRARAHTHLLAHIHIHVHTLASVRHMCVLPEGHKQFRTDAGADKHPRADSNALRAATLRTDGGHSLAGGERRIL